MHVKSLRETTPGNHLQGRWLTDHRVAFTLPRGGTERALTYMAAGITEYAQCIVNGSETGRDGVLTPELGRMLNGFLGLLNGNRGRLDGGTCDTWARATAAAVGWDLDADDWAKE